MINTSSVSSMSSYHQNHFAQHYMTPTRTRRGMAAAAVSSCESGLSKTPSPTVSHSRASTHQRQQPRPATSDFLFSSMEYDFFLKNLAGVDHTGSGHRTMPRKGELFYSASYSPQPMPKMFGGTGLGGSNRPQSTMASVSSTQHYPSFSFQHHKASNSLSSSASSSTSSPARKPFSAYESITSSGENVEEKMKKEGEKKKKTNRRTAYEDDNDDIEGMEAENLSHQHLHALHRFRRQREKGFRSQLRDIVISFTPRARGSILGRDQFFVRFGLEEQKALASFDYLQAELMMMGEDDGCDYDKQDQDTIDLDGELDILEFAASQAQTESISVPVEQMRRLSFSKSRSLELMNASSRDHGPPATSNSFDQERNCKPSRECRK